MFVTALLLMLSRTAWLARPAGATMLALTYALIVAGPLSAEAATSGTSQCVVCHTDAAKLKALTPPDPPPSEEGEG